MKDLKRGDLARAAGVSSETIRYYETQGLLPAPARDANGYRRYTPDTLERLDFIQRAKAMGFSLKDIGELLALEIDRDAHTCEEVKRIAEAKQRDIERRISELKRMQDALSVINARCCGGPHSATHCTILTALADNESIEETCHGHPD
ncbi:Zn(2+)-responsive transcriptional regulator [Larsenimonas suaedae]|uniref:Zn(2+)-responsive transcriptional regulator n=1 Tax=Larsenimonas suaedae TaxID=1851019 RepID=A0ABU1GZB1_9GAMM|nr:Zn(2+)-responsive transcriptional regulator [Larsenimonas suaedae]MCM2971516.1 Zn(2+)-responsive transcriptional regulator [Larsenimonas suaedae]MDR5896772.1 Zn(2+)-responsive transcriptional regulator [Larsenimonas suaedae]